MKYQALLDLAFSLSRLRQDADIPEYPEDLVEACLDSAERSVLVCIMLVVVKYARVAGLLPEDKWVELVSRMRNDELLVQTSALALTLHPQQIAILDFCTRVGPTQEWTQQDGESKQNQNEQNPYGAHLKMVETSTEREEDTQNPEEQNLQEAHILPYTELWNNIYLVHEGCRESDWEAKKGIKLEDPSPYEEGIGKEKHTHTRGERGEEQVLHSMTINSVWLFCAPSFYEKVISPMMLADWKGAQDAQKNGLQVRRPMLVSTSRDKHFSERDQFVARLLPPQHLRVIDCQQSIEKGVVVLIDRHPSAAYTAISHTYGQDIYQVYDCGCATSYIGGVKARANPAKTPCNGHYGLDKEKQSRVMNDMLNMCRILVEKGGVHYAWHDGICIPQYDEEDVSDAIKHMGWIYANAEDTVIFLHYAGQPMALIGTGYDDIPLVSRWHTRAWTFQEAVLSKLRRYCVLQGKTSIGSCADWQDFEDRLALCYVPGYSTIEIIDEAEFFHSIILLHTQMKELYKKGTPNTSIGAFKVGAWFSCLESLLDLLESGLFSFPTMVHALEGSSSRNSKHPGDHINSILAIAGVQDFSVHKDEKVEQSTLEFFKRMGKKGLEFAVFTGNHHAPPSLEECSIHRLTWLPSLCGSLSVPASHLQDGGADLNTSNIEFEVLENGHITLTGPLVCEPVQFYWKKSESQNKVRAAESSSATAAEDISEPAVDDISELAAEDISEPAELFSPNDGRFGLLLHRSPFIVGPVLKFFQVASELSTGQVVGQALFSSVVSPHEPFKDELSLIEHSEYLQGNKGSMIRAICYDGASDDVQVIAGEGEHWTELTVKTMDWREAWVSHFLSRKSSDPSWGAAMQRLFFLRTERVDNLSRCRVDDALGVTLYLQEFFDFPTVHTFVEAEPLQRCKVGSFCASLVFPAELLSRDSADIDICGFQALVLQGDCINTPVTKIGCFNGSTKLHKLLTNKPMNIQPFTKLVIC